MTEQPIHPALLTEEPDSSARKLEVRSLTQALNDVPVDWEEYGGADAVRYTVRSTEYRNILADMLQAVDDAEMDGTYYGEDRSHAEAFNKNMQHLHHIFTNLATEAHTIGSLMRTGLA